MRKIISIVLSFGMLFQQSGLLYAAGEINLANYLSQARNAIVQPDRFQPARLRYISYDMANNDFKLLLDKGNAKLNDATPELFNYFLIGLALPNDTFWVNLRPDAPDNIIDPILEKTDIGKIFLEADLQLKKDTAGLTSPQNPEGKSYWDKLYKKAGELFGTENITIPTITRPWIVPNEVIVRETEDSAYIYKATLKVMLESDYLIGRGGSRTAPTPDQYAFSDPRLKELNEYSSQLIRETIIPKLTKEINSSKRYAQLRQVYYSLVLARWFKQKYSSHGSTRAQGTSAPANSYLSLIDSGDLANLASKESYDKQAYFQAYQKSFKDGEYNLKETVATPFGQSIRSYVSGGIRVGSPIMGGSFYKKGKDFLRKYITKLNSVMYTFMDDMDDAGVVRRSDDNEITGIDVYIALVDIFSDDKAVTTAENLDRLINVFRNADATLFFKGKEDFLNSIALILARFKKNGVYNPMEIRKEFRAKLEDLVMVYENEIRDLINQGTLKKFFNNNKNLNFEKQLTELLDENKVIQVIQAAELIYREQENLYNTNTTAARDLLNVVDYVLRIRDILNSEKPISIASPLTDISVLVKPFQGFLDALESHSKSHRDSDSIKPYYNDAISRLINTIKQQIKLISEGRYPPSVREIGERMIKTEWKDLCDQMPEIKNLLFPKYNDVIKALASYSKGAGSPVIGKTITAYDENSKKIELSYVKLGDLDPYQQQIVKKMIENGLPFPLINTIRNGGRLFFTNNSDYIDKMRFAVIINRGNIEIKGILDNKGSEIEVVGDSKSIEDALKKAWKEEMLFALPLFLSNGEKSIINNIIENVDKVTEDYTQWQIENGGDSLYENMQEYQDKVLEKTEHDIESMISKMRSFLQDKKFVANELEGWEKQIKEIKNSIKEKMRKEFEKLSISGVLKELEVNRFNECLEKNWLLNAAVHVSQVILSVDDPAARKWKQLTEDIISYRLGSYQTTSSPAIASELEKGVFPKKPIGGIDLTDRALQIKLERVGSFAATPLLLPQVKNAQGLDLDREFEQIEALASSGISPNSRRILELFTVCHYRGEFGERLTQIISCLKASSAIQEAQAIDSDEDFRLALMMPEVLS